MCCIFTCCGWMIDLVQRLWTFTMSCCISSAVCCVMLTSSMSGIALGYNYSLAEYIDLKETNVSVYLKRGVFDDEIADDMDWRRSGGGASKDNARSGAFTEEDTTTLRSGRRLDDSVFEADDANKYEGSLMKLTAKPPYQPTPRPQVTDDIEMGQAISKYATGSLDQMKAVQSLIDSRRAMGTGGTTNSPLATYDARQRNLPYLPMYANPNAGQSRRMMLPNRDQAQGQAPMLNPARYAVPDRGIGAPENWLIPKDLKMAKKIDMPDYYIFSPTYPSPITLQKGLNLPKSTEEIPDGAVVFATRTFATTAGRVKPVGLDKDADADKFLMDIETSRSDTKKIKSGKSSEEEYEDEIKGLPVRKRRSVRANVLIRNKIPERNNTNESTSRPAGCKSTKVNEMPSSIVEAATEAIGEEIHNTGENNFTNTKNQTNLIEGNNLKLDIQTVSVETPTNDPTNLDKKSKSETENIVETTSEQNTRDNTQGETLLGRIITTLETKQSMLMVETTQKSKLRSSKKIRIQTRRNSFESKIVSSKYVPNTKPTRLFDTKQTTISNAEILNSINVNLNEAGLLRNPASSTFVKLLQSTLT